MTDAFIKELGNRYQAIYMDPPLLRPGQAPAPNMITVADLVRAVGLGSDKASKS